MKYDITKHKNYPLLSDYDERNRFDVKKYLKNYRIPILKSDTRMLVIRDE